MAKYDNAAHHARQARKNTVLPAQMSKGGDKGPYVSNDAAGELYDLIASDSGPMTPKEANCNWWIAIHSMTPVADGTPVGTVPCSVGRPGTDDLTQATGTKQPLYRAKGQNNRPYLEFDGVDDQMNGSLGGTGIGSHQPCVMMFVGTQRVAPVSDEDWWCGNFSPKSIATGAFNAGRRFQINGDAAGNINFFSTKLWTVGTTVLWTYTQYGTPGVNSNGGMATFRINGEIDGVFSPLCGMDLNVANIGARADNFFAAHLNFYEYCYWASLPSQRTIASVEKYFIQTYGL